MKAADQGSILSSLRIAIIDVFAASARGSVSRETFDICMKFVLEAFFSGLRGLRSGRISPSADARE